MSNSLKLSKSQAIPPNTNIISELHDHIQKWRDCTKCPIGKLAYRHVLYDLDCPDNNARIDILFIGEGPGQTEDYRGLPFVGRSGKLLREAVTEAKNAIDIPIVIGYTNLIACRPCDGAGSQNRSPLDAEVKNCEERLAEFIAIVKPRFIVLCGNVPQSYFKEAIEAIPMLQKRLWGIRHPSFILRTGGIKSIHYQLWIDQIKSIVRRAAREIQN